MTIIKHPHQMPEMPHCPKTGNICLTDTWDLDDPPDCHCGRIVRRCNEDAAEQFKSWDGDKPLPEDAQIDAAHPLETGDHATYAEAQRLVSARHSKGALVELVNWLLVRAKTTNERVGVEVSVPAKPTAAILTAMVLAEYPETWNRGKRLQLELGIDVIAPNSETENMAGLYEMILEAVGKTDEQVMAEVRARRASHAAMASQDTKHG